MRLLIAICLLTALAGRLAFLVQPFNPDSATFIYLGKSVCDGDRFCHDIIDNKFPTVGLMTSLCWRAFGTYWPAYVLLQTTLSLLGALLLGRSTARNIGEHARLPTVLAALIYLNFSLAVFGGFQLETLQMFFSILAVCSAMECLRSKCLADALVVGLCAGCAAMIKPSGLSVVAAFGIVLLCQRDWKVIFQSSAMMLIGLLIPATATIFYLVSIDILKDMPALFRQISDYASNTPMAFEDIYRPITVMVLAGFAIVVRGWVQRREKWLGEEYSRWSLATDDRPLRNSAPHLTSPPRTKERNPSLSAASSIMFFAAVWFALELSGAILQRRMYAYHFLPVAAPAALLFGILPRKQAPLSLLAALAPLIIFSWMGSLEIIKYPEPQQPLTAAGAYLLEHASPGDAVWSDLSPRILLETNLRPGARFPIMFVFGNTDTTPLEYLPLLLSDFESRQPKYIILPSDLEAKIKLETTEAAHLARSPVRARNFAYAWRSIKQYVLAHYVAEANLRRETVYRRIGS